MGEAHFSRYTDLPSLIHILSSRQLTLLNPMTWDDKNDSAYITLYREKSKLASVLALCFTRASETYHHWRIFAPTSSGVRITFNEERLRTCIEGVPGLRLQDVEYVKLEDLRKRKPKLDRLPFLKRYPYQPESEVRLLWESATDQKGALTVPFELGAITDITLSPWLHPTLVESVKSVLHDIPDCNGLTVRRTTLINNNEWLKHGEAAT